jgi:hypothetical protein
LITTAEVLGFVRDGRNKTISAILLLMKPVFSDELLRLLQKISEYYQPPTVKRERRR